MEPVIPPLFNIVKSCALGLLVYLAEIIVYCYRIIRVNVSCIFDKECLLPLRLAATVAFPRSSEPECIKVVWIREL